MADGFLAAILADSLSANSKKCSFLCTFLLSHPARGAWIEILAGVYCRIAQDDLSHVDMLHKQAVEMIGEQKRSGVTVPESMQAVWDFEHERQIEDVADVKRLIDMYKE